MQPLPRDCAGLNVPCAAVQWTFSGVEKGAMMDGRMNGGIYEKRDYERINLWSFYFALGSCLERLGVSLDKNGTRESLTEPKKIV